MAFDAVIITLAGAIVAALFQRYAPDAYMVRNASLSLPCMSRTPLACTRHAACLNIILLKLSLCLLLILTQGLFWTAGRVVSRPADAALLQRRLSALGPQNHHIPRPLPACSTLCQSSGLPAELRGTRGGRAGGMQHWKAAQHQCPARGSILCADAAAASAPAPTDWQRDCHPDGGLHTPHALSQAAALT